MVWSIRPPMILTMVRIMLLSSSLHQRAPMTSSGFGSGAHRLMQRTVPSGRAGQFAIGVLLGAVWSPCAGPILGTASVLEARGHALGGVAAAMRGFGAAASLMLASQLSHRVLMRWRSPMVRTDKNNKILLGAASHAAAAPGLSGLDQALETAPMQASPVWLSALTPRL